MANNVRLGPKYCLPVLAVGLVKFSLMAAGAVKVIEVVV